MCEDIACGVGGGGSWRVKRRSRGVSVAMHGGPLENRSAGGRGDDSVLAYTDARAFFICSTEKWGVTSRRNSW